MKKDRQAEILRLISTYEIETQEMLLDKLKESGYNVTQATVSRDINELGITKGVSEYGINCYIRTSRARSSRFTNIFSETVVSIDYAMNMVAVKCHPGMANAACAGLDIMDLSYVVGTIAGDDTVFILTRTESDAKTLCDRLKQLI
ncbi:MAG: hypothetical protein J1E39_00455 [Eubacterium sp.]|nr:hypothetical protein [Eubacterium sp.]